MNNINHSHHCTYIDLSHQQLNDESVLSIIQNNVDNDYFDGVTSINLSNNLLSNQNDALFILFGQKFKNLQSINLTNSGISPSIYNDDRLKKLFNLFATITWYEPVDDDLTIDDDSFDYMDDDEDDDDEDDENENEEDEAADADAAEDEMDAFICDDSDYEMEDIESASSLQLEIEYSCSRR